MLLSIVLHANHLTLDRLPSIKIVSNGGQTWVELAAGCALKALMLATWGKQRW